MTAELCICGIDPGLTGAVACYFPGADAIDAIDMPVVAGNVDAATLAEIIRKYAPNFAVVEVASSRPKQGIASAHKSGVGYGVIIGVLAAVGVAIHPVSASRWKRHYNLTSDKELSRRLALQWWPARSDLFRLKKHHGRSESAILSRFAFETFPKMTTP